MCVHSRGSTGSRTCGRVNMPTEEDPFMRHTPVYVPPAKVDIACAGMLSLTSFFCQPVATQQALEIASAQVRPLSVTVR